MKFNTVVCPACLQALTVSENAPPKLTCPKCLAPLENPLGRGAHNPPIPVIPISQQTASDGRGATAALFVLIPILLCGIIVAFMSPEVGSGLLIIIVITFGLVAYILVVAETRHTRLRSASIPKPNPSLREGHLDDSTALRGPNREIMVTERQQSYPSGDAQSEALREAPRPLPDPLQPLDYRGIQQGRPNAQGTWLSALVISIVVVMLILIGMFGLLIGLCFFL